MAGTSSLGWRVGFGLTLTLAMAFGTFGQHALSVLAPLIMDDLGISRTTVGGLSTVFLGAGALFSPLAGKVVDRVGGYRLLIALFVVSGSGFAAIAAAPTLAWMWVAVGFAGIAGATCNPVTNDLIAARIEPGQQGVITGIKQSGVQLGAFVAGVALPPLALAIGWRGALGVTAAAALTAAASTPPARSGQAAAPREASGGERAPIPAFVRWLTAYAFLMGAGASGFTVYLPLYSVERLGFAVPTAGLAAALVGLVGVVARVLLTRHAERGGRPERTLTQQAAVAAVSLVGLWSAPAVGAWLLWCAAVGLGVSAAAWNGVAMLAVVRESPPGGTGRSSGIVLTGFYVGLTIAPVALGMSIDRTGSYGPAWAAVTSVFLLATLVSWRWAQSR